MHRTRKTACWAGAVALVMLGAFPGTAVARIKTEKPPLHGRHWVAITGKPLGATAGAAIFQRGGNAVDAACAMLGAVCTMYDVLSWGGETQALVYNPKTKKVIAVNALGVAPTGATPEFFKSKEMKHPPAYGPLAAVTPGTPGGLMTMLAEFGTMSLAQVLAPAIEMAEGGPVPAWVPAAVGFLLGGTFLRLVDRLLPHLHRSMAAPEGLKSHWKRTTLLVLAITLHNFPEGLAVGVAFGAVAAGLPSATLSGAMALALGIGIQNFPEGAAVSVPLRREGISRLRAFWYGQLSGLVEPVAGVLGALAVIVVRPLLPWALAFAAGAMIYVVVEELVPESQREKHSDVATIGAMLGFAVMMCLDVALG